MKPIRCYSAGEEQAFMQQETQAAEFDIEEARRVLRDVFAPWVQDLGLSIERIEYAAPQGAAADWQPGATLRMAFSGRPRRPVTFGRVALFGSTDARPVAMVSSAFAML